MTRGIRPAFADDNPDGIKIGDLVMDHEAGLSGIVLGRTGSRNGLVSGPGFEWLILFSGEEAPFKGYAYSNALELLNAV